MVHTTCVTGADEPPKGVIDLTDSLSIKEIADHPKYECLFVVYTKARNFYLAAYSHVRPHPALPRVTPHRTTCSGVSG